MNKSNLKIGLACGAEILVCGTELDYIEQTSWVLFLKYLDDFESENETAALLNGESYTRIIDGEFRWNQWAAPKPC
jgi:type I restriction enzyme M protein